MDFSVYAQPRKFVLPYLKKTEYVGGEAMLWALVTGPFFFWKKGAMIEGLVIGIATLPFWAVQTDGYLLDAIGAIAWLGSIALAPPLLAASYERRGWVDATNRRLRDPDEDDGLDAWSREGQTLDEAEEKPRASRKRALDLEDWEVD